MKFDELFLWSSRFILEEKELDIELYKDIIDKLSLGEFDTHTEIDRVDRGQKEGVFDVSVNQEDKREVVLTNPAIKAIEQKYPDLKDKFWECGKCKADYPGCGQAKKKSVIDV